jgi:shikimate 5-dehydrogenase
MTMKMIASVVAAVSVLGIGGLARATDINNQDNKAYTVTILDGSVTSTKKLAAHGAFYGLCTGDSCTFSIPGSKLVAGKNDKVKISGGKLTK